MQTPSTANSNPGPAPGGSGLLLPCSMNTCDTLPIESKATRCGRLRMLEAISAPYYQGQAITQAHLDTLKANTLASFLTSEPLFRAFAPGYARQFGLKTSVARDDAAFWEAVAEYDKAALEALEEHGRTFEWPAECAANEALKRKLNAMI